VSDFKFAEAEASINRGLALQPDIDGYFEHAGLLLALGRVEEALDDAKRVQEMDPLSVGAIVLKQYSLVTLGRLEEARAETRRGLDLDSTFVALYQNAGIGEAFGGRPDSALALLRHAYDLNPQLFGNQAYLLLGYAVTGKWAEVDRVRRQIEAGSGGNSPNFFRAITSIVSGSRDSAVTYVERGFEGREPLFLFVSAPCDPTFDLIKREPRYVALMHRYGARICPPFATWPIPPRPKRVASGASR
jgi:tetratricopeptide (TPR) repeat protein